MLPLRATFSHHPIWGGPHAHFTSSRACIRPSKTMFAELSPWNEETSYILSHRRLAMPKFLPQYQYSCIAVKCQKIKYRDQLGLKAQTKIPLLSGRRFSVDSCLAWPSLVPTRLREVQLRDRRALSSPVSVESARAAGSCHVVTDH